MKTILLIIFLVMPMVGWSHSGGLDNKGGHTERSTGNYHCHKEPCLSQHSEVSKSTQEAVTQKRTFSTVYDRGDWQHWNDDDHDCQNTRAETLINASRIPVTFRAGKTCVVHTGQWVDPFTGQHWTLASDLDTDHIVPLAWAHRHGGASWSRDKKEKFANDSQNLLAVEDNLNQSKGAKGPSKWMPPLAEYHCQYLGYWERILTKYGLAFTPEESAAIQEGYVHCFN